MPDPVVHELKAWPAYFRRVQSGEKTFEIRRNDRAYQPGDVLVLREWNPDARCNHCGHRACIDLDQADRYTGEVLWFRVGFVGAGDLFGLALGEHVVLSLLPYTVVADA